ncbi:MAG: S46 family peptidase [Calditrichia bacterium]
MFRKLYAISILMMVLFLAISAFAEEGMWPLNQLNALDWQKLQAEGMQLTPAEVQTMQEAVVLIDGGTGEFVSSKGLILTNHHVAFNAIQYASNVEHNYIQTGFYAKTREEEISVPTYDVRVPESVKDVTQQVLSVVKKGMTPLEKQKAIDRKKQEIEEKAEKNEFTDARVVDMYSGLKYFLFTYKKFKDVRLVYAPPLNIGDYGGEIDNWMWPRQTGDFSIFRVYASPKGQPANYSKNNVPYVPSKYLPISRTGPKSNSFTFVLGYPGTTYRYRTSYSLEFNQYIGYPTRIEIYTAALDVLNAESQKDPENAIKLSGFIKGLNNALKNNQGMLNGFKRFHLVDMKKQDEKEFVKYINSSPDLQKKYGDVLNQIGDQYADIQLTARRDAWIRFFRFIDLPNTVYQAYRYAMEREKPKAERNPEYSKKNMEEMLESLKYEEKDYVPIADKELLKTFLINMAQLPAGQQVKFIEAIVGNQTGSAMKKTVESYVDNLYANTQYKTPAQVEPLFSEKLKQLKADSDPMIQFIGQIADEMVKISDQTREFNANIMDLRSQFMEAMLQWKGNHLYPDANRTLRFTYGTVRGYSPRNAVEYLPFTTLEGMVQKNTGEEPFNAPQKLIQLEKTKDFGPYEDPSLKDVPVDFLCTTDITGGNSGSPVINGKGQLIGIAFDGNYESISSDYIFLPAVTRTIAVDSDYVLFILDKYSNAQNLLNELDIVK